MRPLRALLVLLLLTAACGGDDDADTVDHSTFDQAAAGQRVEALVDRLDADGFGADPNDDARHEDLTDEVRPACRDVADVLGNGDGLRRETAAAETGSHQRGQQSATDLVVVEGSVRLVQEAGGLDGLFDRLRADAAMGCVEDVMRIGFDAGAAQQATDMTMSAIDLRATTPDVDADDAVGYEGSGTIELDRFDLDFVVRLDVARDDRVVAMVFALEIGDADRVDVDDYLALLLE